jgi:Holliday junction resolvase RusA-like endonuclease
MADFSRVTGDSIRQFARAFKPEPITDRPFAPAPDTVLDVPVPPSVNATRKVNWAGHAKLKEWHASADALITASGQYRSAWRNIPRYEIAIILDEGRCRKDPDNIVKHAIDYLRRIEVIQDDSPRHARKITIEWGKAPQGCRLVIKPIEAN